MLEIYWQYCSVYTHYQVETVKHTHGSESTRNNRGNVGNGVFYVARAEML
jgi:ribosomal protein L44E